MIRVDPSFFFFLRGGGYCMMIEIAQMALSYYLNKLRKDCFLKHHGRNDPESAARARGANHSQGASASTPLVDFEWSDIKRCRTELWVRRVASLALLAAEVENFSTFQAPTEASANQIALCKYPSADASQSRSCNTRKVCDWLLSL